MKRIVGVLIVAVFVSATSSICAQSGTSQGTRGRTDPVMRELRRRIELEAIERALTEGPNRRSEQERRIALAQIREDFLRIQIVDDAVKESSTRSDGIDLKLLTQSASEITKRAVRLKKNLALPKSDTGSDLLVVNTDPSIAQLRMSIVVLSNAIKAFVENPMFERSGVPDVKLSAQASRDLEQIIDVSKSVKTSSEKLKRAKK